MDTSVLTHTYLTFKSPKLKLKKQSSHKQLPPTPSTSLSFPKSTITPLLISQPPQTQTKQQALESVIKTIESSRNRGIVIDTEIYSSLLETCYQIQSITHGIKIHKLIPPTLLKNSVSLSSKVVRLYASCGVIETAHRVFDEMSRRKVSAFPWNSLISGYTELGRYEDALALYFQMEEEGVEADQFTFPRVLKACAGYGCIRIGEAVHRSVVRCGFCRDVFILNALVDMYSKCGDIVKARKVFDKIVVRDSVSWNSMLTSYIHHGLLVQALDVFREMLRDGFEPDSIAISSVFSRFSSSKVGFELHAWLLRRGNDRNLSIANSLIAMYSEKRKLAQTRWLFEMMVERDVVSWNSIISGHRKHPLAITYFQQMENSSVLPDNVTFMSLLSTCAHLGRVEEGKQLFVKMKNKYGIDPCMEHYACMVNLLGRAGLINDAYKIITKKMKFEAGPTVWGALLFACSLHGNVDVGEIAAGRLFDLEPDNVQNFELLIEIYGKAGMWNKVEKVMQSMVERGLDS